jgi:hypothetical protein
MIRYPGGRLGHDHNLEEPALCDRCDEEQLDKMQLLSWPLSDLIMHALAGRKVYDFENLERAMLDTLALELHALRGAIELGEVTTDQDGSSETFTEEHTARMLNVLARRAQVGVVLAQRIADARSKPAPDPTPYDRVTSSVGEVSP